MVTGQYICIYTHRYTCIDMFTYTHKHVCFCLRMHVYICTCIHKYTSFLNIQDFIEMNLEKCYSSSAPHKAHCNICCPFLSYL